MGCQKAIAKKIRERGADYILAPKGNQGDFYDEVQTFFVGASEKEVKAHESCDKGHGRIEISKCKVSKDIDWLEQKEKWKDLTCIIEVESTRISKGKTKNEKRYFISSLDGTAEEIGKAIRLHWSIENQLHWVLDVTFNEDKSRIRKRNGPENMAIVRHIVLNLLRKIDDHKTSLKRRRRRALYGDDYLAGVLHSKF